MKMHFRTLGFERAKARDRTVPVVIATEEPVRREHGRYGVIAEVLDCSSINAIDLHRAPLPLIVGHESSPPPIGIVENLHVADAKLRGLARFGESTLAEEVYQDVLRGIVRNVSIGYTTIGEPRRVGDSNTYRFKFCPHEVSVVGVPADPQAGFFRSQENVMEESNGVVVEDDRKSRSERRAAARTENDVRDLIKVGEHYKSFGGLEAAAQAVREGRDMEWLQRELLRRSASGFSTPRGIEEGFLSGERRQYSLLRAVRAQVDSEFARREAGFELEVSRHLAQRVGREPRGLFVPPEALTHRMQVVGTGTHGGNLVATNLLADQFITMLRNHSLVIRMGATVLPGLVGNVAIPRQDGPGAIGWVAEGTAVGTGALTFSQVTMVPQTVGGYVDISRKLMLQGTPEVESLVRNDLVAQIGLGIDAAAINGSGNAPEPKGILNTAGIGTVVMGTHGGAPSWDMVQQLVRDVAVANAHMGALGFLTNANVNYKLSTTPRQASGVEGNFVVSADSPIDGDGFGRLAGYRLGVSNNVPATLTKGTSTSVCSAVIFGNWTDLIIGMWSAIDVLADPYSLSTQGALRVIAMQDADIAVRRPASFSAAKDVLTA